MYVYSHTETVVQIESQTFFLFNFVFTMLGVVEHHICCTYSEVVSSTAQ